MHTCLVQYTQYKVLLIQPYLVWYDWYELKLDTFLGNLSEFGDFEFSSL